MNFFGQAWKKTTNQDGLYAEDKNGGTNAKVGVGTNKPTVSLEVVGPVKLHSNTTIDSTLQIDGNYKLNGQTGTFRNNAWAGAFTRLMQVDLFGNLSPFVMGSSSEYLNGTGTWIQFPKIPPLLWTQSNSGINYNGNVGINNSAAAYALDVNGQIRSSTLGIARSNSLVYADENGVMYPIPFSDSAKVLNGLGKWINFPPIPQVLWTQNGSTINYTGDVNVTGNLIVSKNVIVGGAVLIGQVIRATTEVETPVLRADTLRSTVLAFANGSRVTGDATFASDVRAQNKLSVAGNASFNGNLQVSSLAGVGDREVFADAGGNLKPAPTFITPCSPGNSSWKTGGNTFGTVANAVIGTCDNHDFVLEANNTPYIFLKTNGQVGIGNSNFSPIAMLDIISTGTMPAFNLANSSTTLFSIANDGSTAMNTTSTLTTPSPFVITNSTQNFSGDNRIFEVKYNGAVYTREIFVQVAAFPDYVFKKGYKLMPLPEVEKYIFDKQHLVNMPSAKDVEKDGANLGEIQRVSVEKIEDIYLYIIDINKRVEKLEKENVELKKHLKK